MAVTVNLSTSPRPRCSTLRRITRTVTPRWVHRGMTIRLTGIVLSRDRKSCPSKFVYLRARTVRSQWKTRGSRRYKQPVYGKWVTFMQLHTDTHERFPSEYRFKHPGRHIYPFTAVAPQENGVRDATRTSNIATIIETR